MSIISDKIILPALLATRAAYLETLSQVEEMPLDVGEAATTTPAPPSPVRGVPRIILTLDGEDAHLHATMSGLVDTGLAAKHGIEIVKLAASASKIQQPSDVAPCYRVLKQAVYLKQPHAKAIYTSKLPTILSKVEAASRSVFMTFLSDLPALLSKAFHSVNVSKGWERSGLYPFNLEQMLQQSAGWDQTTVKEGRAVRKVIDELTEYAYLHGEVSDKKLRECFGEALKVRKQEDDAPSSSDDSQISEEETPKRAKKAKKDVDDMVFNRRRALWLNNSAILAQRASRQAVKMAAEAKKSAQPPRGAPPAAKSAQAQLTAVQTAPEKASAVAPKASLSPTPAAPQAAAHAQLQCANPQCLHRHEISISYLKCDTCGIVYCKAVRCTMAMDCHKWGVCRK